MGFLDIVGRIGRTIGVGLGFLFKKLRAKFLQKEGPVTDPILLDGWDLPPNERSPRRSSDS